MHLRRIIRGGHVVTMDAALGELPKTDVLVVGSKIQAVGDVTAQAGDEVIDAAGMIVMPGLIDTHVHLWETVLRGLPYVAPYFTHLYPRRGVLEPEDIEIGVRAGALESLSNGTTTVVDYCHAISSKEHGFAAVSGLGASGARGVHVHGVGLRSPMLGPITSSQRLIDAEAVHRSIVRDNAGGRLSMMIGLSERQHGADVALYCEEAEFARGRGLRMSMHSMQQHHIKALDAAGILGPDMMPVHGTQLSKTEFERMAEIGMPLSFTPTIEYRGHWCAMLGQALEAGVNVVWGVDVPAIIDPDMFAQMRQVVEFQLHHDAMFDRSSGWSPRVNPTLPARRVLAGATIEAARALGLDHVTGSLTPGKEADIIMLQQPLSGPSQGDIAAHLLFQSKSRDVDSVMVAGEFRKRAGRMVELDLPALRAEVASVRDRVLARPFSAGLEWSLPAPDWSHVGPARAA